ncbi:beta-alanine synthetase-like protein, partial [Helicobacter pylori]
LALVLWWGLWANF